MVHCNIQTVSTRCCRMCFPGVNELHASILTSDCQKTLLIILLSVLGMITTLCELGLAYYARQTSPLALSWLGRHKALIVKALAPKNEGSHKSTMW